MELLNIDAVGREERERILTSIITRVDAIKFFGCFPKQVLWPKLLFITVFSIGILMIVAMISNYHCEWNGTCYAICREKYYGQMVCNGRNLKGDAKVWSNSGECSCECNCLSINKTVGQLECTPDACMLEGQVEEFPGRI